MSTSSVNTAGSSMSEYALGYTNAEHERLIRQAERIGPVTERLFLNRRDRSGAASTRSRIGMGDVAMLVAKWSAHPGSCGD